MKTYLGLDTSNYTTSAAYYCPESNTLCQNKKLLPVKEGELGLRQSDALFHHVRQLSPIIQDLWNNNQGEIAAVCVSDKPRNVEGSYMPCFLAGKLVAEAAGTLMHVPVYYVSHQEGHIMAALYSAEKLEYRHQEFLAFHVSGGTFEVLHVRPSTERIIEATILAHTLDISAGQLIDRVGQLLGLGFPAGPALEKLAAQGKCIQRRKPVLKNGCCCLSGFENIAMRLKEQGCTSEDICRTVLEHIAQVLIAITDYALQTAGNLPLVYSGGVMANTYLKEQLAHQYQCAFAEPVYSADNACGTALLGWLLDNR